MGKNKMPLAVKRTLVAAVKDGVQFLHFSPDAAGCREARRSFYGHVRQTLVPPQSFQFRPTRTVGAWPHVPLVVIEDPGKMTDADYKAICSMASRVYGRGPVQIEYGKLRSK